MRKVLLSFLLTLVILQITVNAKGKRRKKIKMNVSELAFPQPRTYKGEPVDILTKSLAFPNGTLATYLSLPNSDAPPALRLLGNSTTGHLDSPLITQVIPFIYALVIAVGIPANVAILCSLASKVRKVSSAILYCSLALSDLLLLLSLFFKAHYHLHGNNWVFGETACRVVTACFYGNLYCSAQTLACISVKRYLAVVRPFLYKRLPKRACTAWASLAVWGVFSAAVVPELLIQQTYRIPQLHITTCHDVLPLDYSSHAPLQYYYLGLTLLGLIIPLVVTTVCFVRIVYELNNSHHDWTMYIKASSLVFVIFLLCFTPPAICNFLHYICLFIDGNESFYFYFNMAVCLCCLHSCLDPFLFLLMSESTGSRFYFMTFKSKNLSIST